MRRLAALLALTLAMTAPVVWAQERDTPLAVGDPAPPFSLTDQHGKSFRLADALAARRFVVLAFYVKAFT
ncbi:MAG: redoxin domain-containing protein, partial [Candidatus Rokuibacteriota bacterium]